MKKHLIVFISMLFAACFADVFASEAECTTQFGTDGNITEIYVEQLQKNGVLRIEYNYNVNASNGMTRTTAEGFVRTNSNNDTNILKISYYLPDPLALNVGDAESYIQDELYDFLHDYSKNKNKYLNYRTITRRTFYNRRVSDFVNNLPENQNPGAPKFTEFEVTYYIY